nr:hypothetical protein [Tanacetum cinerariifolium]
ESVGSSFPRVILIGSIFVEVPVAPKVGAAVVASPAEVLELDTHSSSKADPSENVSVESVGSSFPRVILIGSISVEVPVAPKVGAAVVASPAEVLELDTHSSLKADPSESSPPTVSVALMVLPFLCFDDSESDTEIPKRHVSPTTSTPEIPTAPILPAPHVIVTPSSEFPLVPIVAPPGIRRRRVILIRPGEDIPIDTINADLSTPQRFVHPPLARTPQLDRNVKAEIDACIGMEVDVRIDVENEVEDEVESSDRDGGIDIPDGMLMSNAVDRLDQVEESLQDIYDHVIEIPLQRIKDIETAQKQLEAGQLIASRERASLSDRIRSLEWKNLKEEFRQVRKDRDDTRRSLRRLESFVERRLGFHP